MGSILYLHTVPDCGGDTLFASQYAAYDALSPRMKAYLEGLTATHAGDHVYRRNNALMGLPERGKVYPRASHPVVRTHPVTKRKALYVNGDFTTHIDDCRDKRAAPSSTFCASSARARNSRCGSAGNPTRSPFGTTAASSTRRCGTITRRRAPAAA